MHVDDIIFFLVIAAFIGFAFVGLRHKDKKD